MSGTSESEGHKRFKEGRESLQDDERKGSPSISRTEEQAKVIQNCLAEERTWRVPMLERLRGINIDGTQETGPGRETSRF
jgi:hypothetical protein